MKKTVLIFIIAILGLTQLVQAQSSPQFIQGNDTLVAYRSIPNLPDFVPKVESDELQNIRVISDKFTIRVRSAATNNQWVDVLALYTYNRAIEILDKPQVSVNAGMNSSTVVQHYPNATAGWSQTYGNIEMSANQPVEVEIAPKNSFKINKLDFYKAAVHPSHKASAATVVDGKVYFTISNPAQVAIDINGQMDDFNAFVSPIGLPTDGVSSRTIPIHTITFFANPVIKKPDLNNPRTFYVENGVMPTVSPSTYDTLYFKPGVHDIGLGNKIYPGKTVYIPGDAIIFGSLNNLGVPLAGYTKVGEKIKIYGYGTISGARVKHPFYVSPITTREPIHLDGGLNYQVSGITIVDSPHFSLWTPSGMGGVVSYVKIIVWRANGDGLGNGDTVNDCFVRTNDDCSYAGNNRKRVTFWKDNISAVFYMAIIPSTPVLIEDCDVLYNRSRGGGNAVWDMRGDPRTPAMAGERNTQLTFRNIRLHDKLANMKVFNLNACNPAGAGRSYNWIKFENISIASITEKQTLLGCAAATWASGSLTFENVTFAGTKLTAGNFTTYFDTNIAVNNIIFKSTDYYRLSNNTNPYEGYVITSPLSPNYLVNSTISLSALPRPGYVFTGWSGDLNSATNPISLTMNANKSVKANYQSTQLELNSTSLPSVDDVTIYTSRIFKKLYCSSSSKIIDKIQLIDLTGKTIYSEKWSVQSGNIDLCNIAKGPYIMKIYVDKNIFTKKVICE